ncbi:response regulator transcription factor [Spirochaeta isovalerica]|uniref:DNA-binding response OmpR family regulator n=1 Tax=Spirochaeta isovalerica TaxID=150 RepID=A0A841R2W0_9SPIO|nr:response regulator transcription factor [Spirochaeta isovalerica]MBB6479374.1 DNA-binding response OmpR family regulator [Spirochaeta isovalerica]
MLNDDMNSYQKQTRILMIDDDSKLIDLLSRLFPQYGMVFSGETDPLKGLDQVKNNPPDIVVLDVMMPGTDGFEVCRRIRRESNLPIIMLSARGEAMDRIVGLELGADDYMSKPFEPRELITRIQVILRRAAPPSFKEKALVFGRLEVRPAERDAYFSGNPAGLSSMEYELLFFMASRPGRKFSRDELMAHLQGFDSDAYSRSVDITISRLRSKLGESARDARLIKSVHGFGYVFTGVEI